MRVFEDTVITKILRSDKRDVENGEESYILGRLINYPFRYTSLGELNQNNEKSGKGGYQIHKQFRCILVGLTVKDKVQKLNYCVNFWFPPYPLPIRI
jgi:hypothetical protein